MKRIAVTGGAGFVGSNLVRHLVASKFDVVVIDDLSTGLKSNLDGVDCSFHEISISSKDELYEAIEGCDFIFHLAARGSVPRSIKNPIATFEVNVHGTFNVLELARLNKIPIIFSSSSSVYGNNQSLPKNEYMWTSPMTPYAASKLSGEGLVQSYISSYQLRGIVFRFFNIFGPWQRPDHDYSAVVPKWIWKAMNNQTVEIYGDGNHTRDFTYIDSVVSALEKTMNNNITSEHPINLAFGSRISLNELANQLGRYFPKLKVKYVKERYGDVRNSENDPKRLFECVPDIEITSFENGLSKTIDWFDENYYKIVSTKKEIID